MFNLNSILLFSENPKKLGDFYQKVFEAKPVWEMGGFTGFQVGVGSLIIGPHDKVRGKSKFPERMIFNLETEDVKGEFERIKGLGARIIAVPYKPAEADGMLLATFEDTDGNYFQLATPMK